MGPALALSSRLLSQGTSRAEKAGLIQQAGITQGLYNYTNKLATMLFKVEFVTNSQCNVVWSLNKPCFVSISYVWLYPLTVKQQWRLQGKTGLSWQNVFIWICGCKEDSHKWKREGKITLQISPQAASFKKQAQHKVFTLQIKAFSTHNQHIQ